MSRTRRLLEAFYGVDFQSAGDGLAEVVLFEIKPVTGVFDAGSQFVDLAS